MAVRSKAPSPRCNQHLGVYIDFLFFGSGLLGEPGSSSFMFEHKGVVAVPRESFPDGSDVDPLEVAIEVSTSYTRFFIIQISKSSLAVAEQLITHPNVISGLFPLQINLGAIFSHKITA